MSELKFKLGVSCSFYLDSQMHGVKNKGVESVFEKYIEGLVDNEFAVHHDLFDQSTLTGLQQNALAFFNNGRMKPAGIGAGNNYHHNNAIRTDNIKWLDHESTDVYEREFFAVMDAFVNYLNCTCYAGIKGYEFHYAVYEPGSFFKRHLDCFKNDSTRKFSVITYLNSDWKAENGGELVAYLPNGDVKFLPEFGRTIMFKSDSVEHEVLPANRTRISITGWLRG